MIEVSDHCQKYKTAADEMTETLEKFDLFFVFQAKSKKSRSHVAFKLFINEESQLERAKEKCHPSFTAALEQSSPGFSVLAIKTQECDD